MAYVQEIIVSALLECTHDDLPPSDDHLLKSVDTLRSNAKKLRNRGNRWRRETVGFCASDDSNSYTIKSVNGIGSPNITQTMFS